MLMLPKIVRPQGQVEIVTDFPLLEECQTLSSRIEQLVNISEQERQGFTDGEIAQRHEEADRQREQLKRLLKKVDESTLVICLQGLTSSAWEQILAQNETMVNGKPRQDTLGVVAQAIVAMATEGHMKSNPDVIIEFDAAGLDEFIRELPDSQAFSLLQEINRLNMPRFAVPKA